MDNPKIKKWERIKDKTETADINAKSMARAMTIQMSNKDGLDGSV